MTIQYRLRTVLASSEPLYLPLYRLLRSRRHGLLSAQTALTIEGFPRSGNSFAVRAFAMANPQVEMAHHTHAAAQVLGSVRRGLPTLVLFRQPVDALRSFLVLRPELDLETAAWSYTMFHRPLLRVLDRCMLASFEEATADMGGVIRRLNQRFATRFAVFDHSPENVERVFAQMEEDHRRRYGAVKPTHLARPVESRKSPAGKAVENGPRLREALAVYDEFRRMAGT